MRNIKLKIVEPDFDLTSFKYKRLISVGDLPKREKGFCRWCGNKCEGRRTRWCSDDCVESFDMLFNWNRIRSEVLNRDNHTCQLCGSKADNIRKSTILENEKHFKYFSSKSGRSFEYWLGRSVHRSWLEVDHIVPVVEGGGCCGLDNLRTVCFICHRKETNKLKKRISRRKNNGVIQHKP